MSGIIIAMAAVGGVGLFIGLFLGAAAIQFKVKTDVREAAVLEALPGNNCGGCGYAGCSGLAAAIVKGEAAVDQCPVGGAATAQRISEIMGVEAGESRRMRAFVACQGDCDRAKSDYEYTGIEDCRMLEVVPDGGPKRCNYGCLGYGSCVRACPFDAIHVENGVAVVDKESCKACGKCVEVCPKKLISLIPYDAPYQVACSSGDRGPAAMKACDAACIGCAICKKSCPAGAVRVEDFHASIDGDQCTGCGICVEKCPRKSIVAV